MESYPYAPAPAVATDTEPERPFWTRLEVLGPDRLLVLLAGVCALAFGTLALVLHLAGEAYVTSRPIAGFSSLGGVLFTFVVTLVFGVFLLYASAIMEKRVAEGSILGLAFSIVLLVLGGTVGLLAGLLGLVGALVGIVRNLKFVSP